MFFMGGMGGQLPRDQGTKQNLSAEGADPRDRAKLERRRRGQGTEQNLSAEGADPRDQAKFERRRRESKGLRALKGPQLRISSVPCIRAFGARILFGPLDVSLARFCPVPWTHRVPRISKFAPRDRVRVQGTVQNLSAEGTGPRSLS